MDLLVLKVFALGVLSVCISTQSTPVVDLIRNGTLQTYLEEVRLQGIAFQKRQINRTDSTNIQFNVSSGGSFSELVFSWLLDGTELKVTRYTEPPPAKPGSIYSTEDGSRLTLHIRDKALTAGNYTLIVSYKDSSNGASVYASGFVLSAPILPLFPKDRRVLEGDRLILSCEVAGYPLPTQVNWMFAHINPDLMEDKSVLDEAKENLKTLNCTPTCKFNTQTVQNDQLVFMELPQAFNGLYQCNVNMNGDSDETLILVNVKDRWAALWPFIGIVIEVTVLVTAILLYERHQMRSKRSKTDATPAPDVMSPSGKTRAQSQQQQPNSLTVPVNATDPSTDTVTDGVKTETGDTRPDDLRQRNAPKC